MLGRGLTDDRHSRALDAYSLTNNSGELWALDEAFLWLRDESVDDKSVSVTLVYDSEVARGLVTEPWAPQSHLRIVSLLRDRSVEACNSRLITWVHVRGHGSHLMKEPIASVKPVDRASLVFVLQPWVYSIRVDEPELAVERCRWCPGEFFLP